MKPFGLFSFLLLFSIELYAGAFANFRTKPVVISNNLHNSNDRLFVKSLNHRWHNYLLSGIYKQLFNVKVTKTKQSFISALGPRVILSVKPLHVKYPEQNISESLGNTTIDFFGSIIAFNIPSKLLHVSLHVKSKKDIVKAFDLIASSKYQPILSRILILRKNLQLNDWGTFLLVRKLTNKLFQPNFSNIFTCFLLNKLHFNVKVALLNNNTGLLIHSKDKLYNRAYYIINHKRYYLFLKHFKRDAEIFTYTFNYPHAANSFSFMLKRLPFLSFKPVFQKLAFNYEGVKYKFMFTYNKNILDFLDTYPQVNMSIYAHAPISRALYNQIATQLINDINGKSASRAMNFVLLFTQHILALHNKNTTADKLMFGEQTLYYGSLNSFNRSILYKYIMKNLFNVATRVVIYKHYAATAIDIPMKGYGFFIQGRHFVIADPSFINGNLGQCRPRYQDIAPVQFIE